MQKLIQNVLKEIKKTMYTYTKYYTLFSSKSQAGIQILSTFCEFCNENKVYCLFAIIFTNQNKNFPS